MCLDDSPCKKMSISSQLRQIYLINNIILSATSVELSISDYLDIANIIVVSHQVSNGGFDFDSKKLTKWLSHSSVFKNLLL